MQDPDKLSDAGEAGGESDQGRDIPVVPRAETPKNAETPKQDSPPGRMETPRRPVGSTESPKSSLSSGGEPVSASLGPQQSALSTALLAQQLPPIGKFNGETNIGEGETFEAWHEQFEMVAAISHWDAQAKLVNLTTRLKGQAYTFYRSCTVQQRASYELLVAELTQRFKPVRLQSVQSSMFHERKQKPNESVDTYAQDLRRLFHLAYPKA